MKTSMVMRLVLNMITYLSVLVLKRRFKWLQVLKKMQSDLTLTKMWKL